MVQALNRLILDKDFDETSLKDVFSNFNCSKDSDVKDFLLGSAIDFERKNIARTFLVLDDEAFSNNKIKINGFFSLSIKSILFDENVTKTKKSKLSKDKDSLTVAGYLLGQLAKDDSMPAGYGKQILEMAVSKIKEAMESVAGRFFYLDCKENLIDYYLHIGLTILQKNDESNLTQMYAML